MDIKKVKLGSKIELPYCNSNGNIVDEIADIEVTFNDDNDAITVLLVTKSGYLVYDDQLNTINVVEDSKDV